MASDLPDHHKSPTAMARCLASYMDDPEAIRREVLVAFGMSPTTWEIREMRRKHLKPKPKDEPFKPHEGYHPCDVPEAAAEASRDFLWRLDQERLLSQRRKEAQAALASPLLERPALIDKRWDKEIEAAFRANSELSDAA